MEKELYSGGNDLCWLSNASRIQLKNSFLGLPNINTSLEKKYEFEPWERVIDPKVCRNLNSSFGINSANGLIMNSGNSMEKIIHDKYIGEMENCSIVQQNLNYYGNLENELKNCTSDKKYQHNELIDENIDRNFSPSSTNKISNFYNQDPLYLSQLLSNFNEDNKSLQNQNENTNIAPCSLYPINSFNPAFNMNRNKIINMQLINANGGTYLPTSYKTPTKSNTDLVALMQELAIITGDDESSNVFNQNIATNNLFPSPPNTPITTPPKGCVFCKNNSYHSTFYKSHTLKDDHGHCQCPVLRTYVCPLCGGTGDSAHTLKYCPKNTVTRGDPIAAGLPPGKVTNWREVATKMVTHK